MKQHKGQILAQKNNVTVIDCTTCGFAHQSPLPTQQEIDNYYNNDEFYNSTNGLAWFAKQRLEHELGLWDASYQWQSDLLEPYDTIVDIGCGVGWFVKWALKNDKDAWGVEPSALARKYSVIAETRTKSTLAEVLYRKGKHIKVIRLGLVLEHILNPVKFLANLPCEKVLIFVPSEFSLLQEALPNGWSIKQEHINYFTAQGLKNCMSKAGYRVIGEYSTMPMPLFLSFGLDYIDNPEFGHKLHILRLAIENVFRDKAFSVYKRLYDIYGWSGGLVFVGEKQQ